MNALADALLGPFVWPEALLTLAAVPVAVWLVRMEARRRRAARLAFGGPVASLARSRAIAGRIAASLLVVAVVLTALTFARPRWGSQEVPLEQRGIDVVVVLDVSRSMLAEDVSPSRARASAATVNALLTHLQGNRVGLVTFAGSAFPRSPLTLDIEAVQSLVRGAQGESSLVRPGSDLGGAVQAALALLDVEDRALSQAVVVVTDGEVYEADITAVGAAASRARRDRVRVFGVFAATEAPVALPASSGGTDTTRGQRTPLAALAEATGGEVRDLERAAGLAVEFRRLQQTRFAEASRHTGVERFQWFAGAALALLVVQTALARWAEHEERPRPARRRRTRRRRTRAAAALVASILAAVVLGGCATVLGTPAYRAVAEGNRLYAQGRYEEALAAYDRAAEQAPGDPTVAYNRALALHRLERYDESFRAVTAALNDATGVPLATRMEYTAGNAAVALERLTEARDRYVAALRLTPDDADAKANLELLLTRVSPDQQPGAGNEGQTPQSGDRPQGPQPNEAPGQAPPQSPPPSGTSGAQQGTPPQPSGAPTGAGQTPQPGVGAGDALPGEGPPGETVTAEQAEAALQAALAALGPEITRDEALRLLELARQANALARQPRGAPQGGGPPPPR